jgi:hypothetical protein
MKNLILSLFLGADLPGRGFEAVGFCVVRSAARKRAQPGSRKLTGNQVSATPACRKRLERTLKAA